jgi:hypothetical protein
MTRNWKSKFLSLLPVVCVFLLSNPYSDTYEQPQHEKTATDYARPPKGSKTEARGVRAGNYILNQVKYLCEIISKYGVGPDEHREIKFGYLFKLYEFIGYAYSLTIKFV